MGFGKERGNGTNEVLFEDPRTHSLEGHTIEKRIRSSFDDL